MKIFKKGDLLKAVAISLAFGATVALAAWTGPTAAPPGNNTPPPLNVGSVGQTKGGNLALNLDGTLANGLLVPFGKVGIGTNSPQGALQIGDGTGVVNVIISSGGGADDYGQLAFKRNKVTKWAVGTEVFGPEFYIWNSALNQYALKIRETNNALFNQSTQGMVALIPGTDTYPGSGLELRNADNGTPYLDFLSSADWNNGDPPGSRQDYDARIIYNPSSDMLNFYSSGGFQFQKRPADGGNPNPLFRVLNDGSILLNQRVGVPASPTKGQIYFNSTDNHFYGWNGTVWRQLDN